MPSEERPLSEVSNAVEATTSVVGRYRLVRSIGRGGFAQVFLARDVESYAPYALKILRENLDPRIAEQVRTRFLAEERISKAIGHSAIVKIRETSGPGSEPCFIAMEYIQGKPFCAHFQALLAADSDSHTTFQTQHFLFEVARLGHQVAEALACAHAQNIVHRDLKPDNVLVALNDDHSALPRVKILDFGIAKAPVQLFTVSAPTVTRYWTELGTVMGSPPYMAPEQNGSAHTVNGKADVHALGVMLLMSVFRLDYESIEHGRTTLTLPQDLERLSLLGPPIPEAWLKLLARMIAPAPEARPSMLEVARALQRLARPEVAFARAVQAFFERGRLPRVRALREFQNFAEHARYLTDEEAEFLKRVPTLKLERARRFNVVSVGLASALIVAVPVTERLLASKHALSVSRVLAPSKSPTEPQVVVNANAITTPARADAAEAAQTELLSALKAQLDEQQSKLSSQLRVNDDQKIGLRALGDKLAACNTAKEQLEKTGRELTVRVESTEKQLNSCRTETDEHAASVSSCQRELGGKAQDLAESTDRLHVCTKSLRACKTSDEPAVDGPS
jgi:serine/threonine protein kinase